MTSMTQQPLPVNPLASKSISRRGILRVGGASVAVAALVAACGDVEEDANPARVGSVPPLPTLPEGIVSDGVIFRTATSMHYSFIDSLEMCKKLGELTADQTALVERFIAAHEEAIKDMQEWTITAGAEPWTCANPRFDRVTLVPIEEHITGRPKQGNEEADVPPSDDPNRDCLSTVAAMETLCAEMHQSFVQTLSLSEYRRAVINQGQLAARRSARQALEINPENIFNPTALQNANPDVTTTTAAATTTTQNIAKPEGGGTTTTTPQVFNPQVWYAIPSQFGALSAVQLQVGAPTASGSQFTINMETPSLNSYIYDYMTC
jgi:hypothetical protein